MPRGADGIVQALKEAGVSTIFGIPSIHNIGLYESLRHTPSIRHIGCRHEAGATHMADGYARASGGLGVIVSSTGPGAGFTVSALQEAWGSCSPVLMITTNIDASKIGKGLGVLHELEEQTSLFRTITKEVCIPRADDDLYTLAKHAIALAQTGRPGPVCLEVPTDLMAGEAPAAAPTPRDSAPASPPLPPRLDEAVAILRNAKQPLILAGTDASRANIDGDIQALAEALCAPVITNTPGKGVVPEDHALAFGNAARKLVVKEIVPGCDAAVAIGSRLREVDAKRRGLVLPEQLIHIDWDERWISRNYPAAVPLVGDIAAITRALRDQLEGEPYAGPRQERTAAWRQAAAAEFERLSQERPELQSLQAIRAVLPRDSALVIDNTQLGYWAEYFYPSYQTNGIIGAKGSGLLGFSFPAAIGVKLARPDTPVVGLIGDGGFLYTAQELATCVRHDVGFPLVVVNDNAFGVIDYLQRTAYQEAYQAQLTNPDFLAFSAAFGVPATRVHSPTELQSALDRTLASGEMHLIEYQMTIQEPPFGKY
jgi:acetolactate synthase-1/2/3 large subunit